MRLISTIVLILVAAATSVGCSSDASPTPTATDAPSPAVSPVPAVSPIARSTPTAVGAPSPAPVVLPTAAPTPAPTATLDDTPASVGEIVIIELSPWVEEAPAMAQNISGADVIATARLVSLDSATRPAGSWGYEAELIYRFEVIQYLKGNGGDELVVRMTSGPKYIAFPDWLDHRTESEARSLASTWLTENRSKNPLGQEPILFLKGNDQEETYRFSGSTDGQGNGGYPVIGRTWLPEDQDSLYQHKFLNGESATISLFDLRARIEEMSRLRQEEHWSCISSTVANMSNLQDKVRGGYRILGLGGYYEPSPKPQFALEMDTNGDYTQPFIVRRPPYQTPRFSHYWLEGPDKDLFEMDESDDYGIHVEWLRVLRPLPVGEYNVFVGEFHSSLPCNDYSDGNWRVSNETEWLIKVTEPE